MEAAEFTFKKIAKVPLTPFNRKCPSLLSKVSLSLILTKFYPNLPPVLQGELPIFVSIDLLNSTTTMVWWKQKVDSSEPPNIYGENTEKVLQTWPDSASFFFLSHNLKRARLLTTAVGLRIPKAPATKTYKDQQQSIETPQTKKTKP